LCREAPDIGLHFFGEGALGFATLPGFETAAARVKMPIACLGGRARSLSGFECAKILRPTGGNTNSPLRRDVSASSASFLASLGVTPNFLAALRAEGNPVVSFTGRLIFHQPKATTGELGITVQFEIPNDISMNDGKLVKQGAMAGLQTGPETLEDVLNALKHPPPTTPSSIPGLGATSLQDLLIRASEVR